MKNKNVAGILALLFGLFGVHRFYLGQRFLGALYFIGTIITFIISINIDAPVVAIFAILGFIDGILFLSMPKADFDRKHNRGMDRYADQRHWYSQPAPAPYASSGLSFKDYKRSGIEHFRKYRFEEAAEDFEAALEHTPGNSSIHFNLACTYSMLEEATQAFYHLEKAVENGFRKYEKIHGHDALAFIRSTPAFDEFVDNGYRRPPQALPSPQPELLSSTPRSEEPAVDILEQIMELGKLRDKGVLTEEEFAQQKRRLLKS